MSAVTVRGTSIIVLCTAHLLVVAPSGGFTRHVFAFRVDRVTTWGDSSSSEEFGVDPELGDRAGHSALDRALAHAEHVGDLRLAHVLVVTEHDRGAHPPRQPLDRARSEEHTSELQSPVHLVCRLLLEKKKNNPMTTTHTKTKKKKKKQ